MLAANPWPTIRNPMPRTNALGNNVQITVDDVQSNWDILWSDINIIVRSSTKCCNPHCNAHVNAMYTLLKIGR